MAFKVKIECEGILHHQLVEDQGDLDILMVVLKAVESRAVKKVIELEEKKPFPVKYEECTLHSMQDVGHYWKQCTNCGALKPLNP
jgi:hypothetical protein